MKFGGPFPFTGPHATRESIVKVAKTVEAQGFDYIWIGDHLIFPKELKSKYILTEDGSLPIDPRHNFLEIFTTFAFLAGQTTKLRFHTNIYILPLRHPTTAARLAASLDYLSNGRLTLVLGSGWMKDEYDLTDIPWHERGKRFDEGMKAMRAIIAEEPFKGEIYTVEPAWFRPKPVQNPLPLWIGGDSEIAIRRAAQLADGWAPTIPITIKDRMGWLKDKVGELRAQLDQAGRDSTHYPIVQSLGFIGRTQGRYSLTDKRDMLLEEIAANARIGVTHISMILNELNSPDPIEKTLEDSQWFAEEVMPKARAL